MKLYLYFVRMILMVTLIGTALPLYAAVSPEVQEAKGAVAQLKKYIKCAMGEGCTKEETAQIRAMIGTIVFALGVAGLGTWAYRRSRRRAPIFEGGVRVQDPHVKAVFDKAVRSGFRAGIVGAIKQEGLLVGPDEVTGLIQYYTSLKRKGWNDDALKFRNELHEYFRNRQHDDQLLEESRDTFWNWAATLDPELEKPVSF